MIPDGWSATDWRDYKAALPMSTRWDLNVRVMDLAHRHVGSLGTATIDGQWNLDATVDIDRTLQLSMANLNGNASYYLHPDIAPRRLVQVQQGTWVESLGKWMWVPVFTGRPSAISGDGESLNIEAQGKECLHLRTVPPATIRKGTYVVDAIRNGLAAAGEVHVRIPSRAAIATRVARDLIIGGSDETQQPWKVWTWLASSAGCQLFFDGAGRAILRRWPTSAAITIKWDERTVLSKPLVSTDMTGMRNRWYGAGKGTLRADVSAVGNYSPAALAINGVPWSNMEWGETNDTLNTSAKLETYAKNRLNQLVTLTTELGGDVVPFHAVDPYDYCQVQTPAGLNTFPLRTCSVPLIGAADTGSAGWPMTLGYLYRVRRASAGRVRAWRLPAPAKKKKKG